jgi:hypothetical protein
MLLAGLLGLGLVLASAAAGQGLPRLRVSSVSPRPGVVAGNAAFTMRFSVPLAPGQSAKLTPTLRGSWTEPTPRTLRFTPASAYLPGSAVRLTIPAGVHAADGAALARTVRFTYHVGEPSPARLAQMLAELRYLPVHFVSRQEPPARDLTAQLLALYAPPAGRFVFGHGWPRQLHQLWAHDKALVLRGAVVAFESQHALPMDGVAGPRMWKTLLDARSRGQLNRHGFSYAVGSERSPETLTVYHNGAMVVRTPANTGIPAAPTALGTFPVYERLRSQVMQGTNPDGSHYADYVQWVAYFNGGDAVHYIPRSSWGYPQSLGCIEVPYSAAERAWGYLTYGTLVTVEG